MNELAMNAGDIRQIMSMLPHRYPFLLVDRIVECTPHTSIRTLKNVTINEPFFQGHFPGLPVMPGVLILEALAQSGALLLYKSVTENMDGKIFMFTGIDKVRFRRPVFPGDQLILRCEDIKNKFNIWKMTGVATVNDEVKVQGVLSAALINRDEV
jgi:3-hydroxyacyl-[acyl-carrier-protein] dehydratase